MRHINPRTRRSTFVYKNISPETRVTTTTKPARLATPIMDGLTFGLHEYKGAKTDLTDCTFIIPVSFDSIDRQQNLELTINHLNKHFDTNIIVGEQGTSRFGYVNSIVKYTKFDYDVFHRTKMLNEMTKAAQTKFVFNWDADVFIAPAQLLKAVLLLRAGVDFVYPYDGRFARVPRHFMKPLSEKLDMAVLAGQKFAGMYENDMVSVGGAIGYNKESFLKAGGENEYFISYSPEDAERKIRFERLGYTVDRVKGALYHLDHYIGVNSSSQNPYFKAANEEYLKVVKMDKSQLQAYIKTWAWNK